MRKIEKKTGRMLLIEKVLGEEIEEILRDLYVDKELSLMEMQNILQTNRSLIIKWLKRAGIYSRKLNIG